LNFLGEIIYSRAHNNALLLLLIFTKIRKVLLLLFHAKEVDGFISLGGVSSQSTFVNTMEHIFPRFPWTICKNFLLIVVIQSIDTHEI